MAEVVTNQLAALLTALSERQAAALRKLLTQNAADVDAWLAGDRTAWRRLQDWGQELIEPLILAYAGMAGTVAADWYELEREARGVPGRTPTVIPQAPRANINGLMGFVLKNSATQDGFAGNLIGGSERRLFQVGNGTVMDAVLRDPHGQGWARIARSGGCQYCLMLAGRGHVYRSEQTASFAPHDHCRCVVSPVWDAGTQVKVPSEYTPSERFGGATPTDAQRERRAVQNDQARRWIEQNRDTLGLIGEV